MANIRSLPTLHYSAHRFWWSFSFIEMINKAGNPRWGMAGIDATPSKRMDPAFTMLSIDGSESIQNDQHTFFSDFKTL
jgi:hypothetical protein